MLSPIGAKSKRRRGLIYWAKIILPLLAVSIVAIVAIWSRIQLRETRINVQELKLQSTQTGDTQETGTGLNVKNVLYDGKDDKGRPYHIAAANAWAQGDEGKDYRLSKPQGDISLGKDEWAALKADKGYYWADKKMVDFSDNVVLFRNDGLVFETEAASMDIKEGTFAGQKPVKGGNAAFEVESESGFQLLDDGDHVLFLGRSRARIFENKDGGKEEAAP